MPQKAIKGQALEDFLAQHPVPDDSLLLCELPGEEILFMENDTQYWELYFDGASLMEVDEHQHVRRVKVGVGLVYVTPTGGIIYQAINILDAKTNNEAEYEALILGLEIALHMDIQNIHVFGDFQLVVNQVTGDFKVYKPELSRYCKKATTLLTRFAHFTIQNIPRAKNSQADALAKLAKELIYPDTQHEIQVLVRPRKCVGEASLEEDDDHVPLLIPVMTTEQAPEQVDWRQPFMDFFMRDILPDEKLARYALRKRALRYMFINASYTVERLMNYS